MRKLGFVLFGFAIGLCIPIPKEKEPIRWKIIAGHSETYTNGIGISIQPVPAKYPGNVVYFPLDSVFVGEITDQGKEFSFKYIIKTNTLYGTQEQNTVQTNH